ncbi:unnamed protein product [Heligmosomoides polygyrus]|uniref:RICTOR_V domain-containing protein n=1 Tax=Heligmosomoides polygyrus TaxID=6339 RepID=A0A183F4S8_HELPZ|nr:unnamed protein product [Heligmosomoides polygyrus]
MILVVTLCNGEHAHSSPSKSPVFSRTRTCILLSQCCARVSPMLCLGLFKMELRILAIERRLLLTESVRNPARRWCTRFLSALAYRRLPNFSEWGFRLLLGQLGDESVKVISYSIRILHTWLPVRLDWILSAMPTNTFVFWMKTALASPPRVICQSFNVRYVEAVDDEMRDALLSVRRTINGTFSRVSGDGGNHDVRAPPHLFASLSRHGFGSSLLIELNVVDSLMEILSSNQDPASVKAALMALGHIGSSDEGFKLLPVCVVPQMVRMAEEAAVLSVRGYAFWALTILSSSLSGRIVLINIRLIFLLVQNELACSFSVESPKSEAVVLRFLTVYKSERFQIQVSASTA